MATRTPPRGTPYPKPTKRTKRRKKGLKRQRRPRSDDEIATWARYRLRNPDCEWCLSEGVMRPGSHTHHILGGDGRRKDLRFNLMTLCLEHHMAVEARKKHWTPLLKAIKQAKGEWDQREADRISHGNREVLNETG